MNRIPTFSHSAGCAAMGRNYMRQLEEWDGIVGPKLALQWRMQVCRYMDAATAARCAERVK